MARGFIEHRGFEERENRDSLPLKIIVAKTNKNYEMQHK